MLKAELDKYIGKEVTVVFKRGVLSKDTLNGRLGFAYDYSYKYGWRKPNYYYIDNCNFKASHVKQLYVNENINITKAY